MKKNIIKESRRKELEARREAKRAAARLAELNAIKSRNITDTMGDIGSNVIVCRDDDGTLLGLNGGKYRQVPVEGGTIASTTEEGVEAIKNRMSRGITGDGLLHKLVIIQGFPCDCVGATEEELEADIRQAEEFAQAHGATMARDCDVAEQLSDAGYTAEELEQLDVDGKTYLLVYPEKRIMDLQGQTLVDCEDITSQLQRKELKAILLDRLSGLKR